MPHSTPEELAQLLRDRVDELRSELEQVMADVDPATGKYPWAPHGPPTPPTEPTT